MGRYGYRRITLEMRNRGYIINHKTVSKLMKQLNLKCVVRMKKYRSYRGQVGKIAPNLINRDFHAEAPNQNDGHGKKGRFVSQMGHETKQSV